VDRKIAVEWDSSASVYAGINLCENKYDKEKTCKLQ
jgi:hypothetical protein